MRFRLATISITIDDLELNLLKVRIFGEFRGISQIWEATTSRYPVVSDSVVTCNPLNVLLNIVFLA